MDLSGTQQSSHYSGVPEKQITRVQLFCPQARLPEQMRPLLNRNDAECSWVMHYEAFKSHKSLDKVDFIVFAPGSRKTVEDKRQQGKFLQLAQQKAIPMLLLTEDDTLINMIPLEGDQLMPRVQFASPDISTDELWGRINAMLSYAPTFNRIENHMKYLEKWAFTMNNRFEELSHELRLAWRVQQDFLPKKLPKLSKIQFATMYRPATWVSGDIYDIFQLDESHVGFYIADVVGHGVAAGLMTLFVKRALVTKEILGNTYRLLEPNQALERLNKDIASLELPGQQFVTTAYGILNTKTYDLTFARGGHPYPLLYDENNNLSRIECEGPLMGVFPEAEFDKTTVKLTPGSKLVIYSDGLEQAFGSDSDEEKMIEEFSKVSHKNAQDMIDSLAGSLDCQENSLNPEDDMTVLAVEIAK